MRPATDLTDRVFGPLTVIARPIAPITCRAVHLGAAGAPAAASWWFVLHRWPPGERSRAGAVAPMLRERRSARCIATTTGSSRDVLMHFEHMFAT
jgi:hypothetical protein